MVHQAQRSVDSVYEEIAALTGNRAELERERFLFIKAIRALKALIDDSAIILLIEKDRADEIKIAIDKLEGWKGELWINIEKTDRSIQRLTDLVQNGAYND